MTFWLTIIALYLLGMVIPAVVSERRTEWTAALMIVAWPVIAVLTLMEIALHFIISSAKHLLKERGV
jgi:hypothetical protein